jgi:uncharacterized protein YqjF (DUF2071 family)
MHPSLAHVEHRPWPLPEGPWTWRQQWVDLLFAHWPVASASVRRLVPEALEVDEFEGQTYIALVPFRMTGVMKRPFPDVPGVSAFEELNVRLYVKHQGRAGVWFLSLDPNNHPAVWAARQFFNLPYYYADMSLEREGERVRYRSRRRQLGYSFVGSYGPNSEVRLTEPGTLDHWLTERYCLYAQKPDGSIQRTEVHHAPWPLQLGEAKLEEQSMLGHYGFGALGRPPLLHFARFIDVVVWDPETVVPARTS